MKNFIKSSVTCKFVVLATIMFVLLGAFQAEKLAVKIVRTDWALYNISEEISCYERYYSPTEENNALYDKLQKERSAFINSTDSVESWCATTNDFFQLMSGIIALVAVPGIPAILLLSIVYAYGFYVAECRRKAYRCRKKSQREFRKSANSWRIS